MCNFFGKLTLTSKVNYDLRGQNKNFNVSELTNCIGFSLLLDYQQKFMWKLAKTCFDIDAFLWL